MLVIPSAQDAVSCVGCNCHFHVNCAFIGSSTELRGVLAMLRLRENVVFLCSCCKQWIVQSNFNVLINKIKDMSTMPNIAKIEEDIATNKKLIEELSSKLNETSSSPGSSFKRLSRKEAVSASIKKASPTTSMPTPVGTFGTCADNDLVAIEVPKMKQLYVSHLDPSTTAEQVAGFICKKVEHCNPADLDCRSLLKKDRSKELRLTFISFRISIPEKLFSEVSDPAIWPEKVLVREFVQRAKNFRTPSTSFPTL